MSIKYVTLNSENVLDDRVQKLLDFGKIVFCVEPHMVSLKNHQEKHSLAPNECWFVAKSVIETLIQLHDSGYIAGQFTRRDILLECGTGRVSGFESV